MRFIAIVSLVASAVVVLSSGCKSRLSAAQCMELIDKLLDLKIDEDPRANEMSPAEKDEVRGVAKKEMIADPDVKQVQGDCQSEVTPREYDCAIHAKSSAEWNACIE
jgi:hypothetical protein